MINSVILSGRIANDLELRHTNTGDVPVITFNLAVERGYSVKDKERETDFITVVAWRKTAEFVAKYFEKGDGIGVQGALQTRQYQDKEGNKRTAYEVVADRIHFLDGKKNRPAGNAETAAAEYEFIGDEDVPF